MARKQTLTVSVLAAVLIACLAAAILQTQAFAKNQAVDAKKVMATYSAPGSSNTGEPTRKSRVKQQNIVSEAANVLNVLPMDIINEMKKGKTLVQIAKDKGLSEPEFTQKLKDFDAKTVNAAVKEGTITKEHATAINEGRADRIQKGLKEKAMNVNDHMAMDMGN
jgi:hypothetical protein